MQEHEGICSTQSWLGRLLTSRPDSQPCAPRHDDRKTYEATTTPCPSRTF